MTVQELIQKLAKLSQKATVVFEPRNDPMGYTEISSVDEQDCYLETNGMFDPDAPIDDFRAVILS